MKQLFCVWIFCLLPLSPGSADESVTLCFYNLKNYRVAEHHPAPITGTTFKSPSSLEALHQTILVIKPDVLVVSEMGDAQDLSHLKHHLENLGLSFPYHAQVQGFDAHRRLAILSRFSLRDHSPPEAPRYLLDDKIHHLSRNLLDVEILISDSFCLRLVACHLKSRREVPEGSQEWMRRNEAHLVRKHVTPLATSSQPFLLCGDFNEYKNHPSIQEIEGRRGSNSYLKPQIFKDSRGDVWTHFWAEAHQYSRFDYMFVNPALQKHIAADDCRIEDGPLTKEASDHRPIFLKIRLPKENRVLREIQSASDATPQDPESQTRSQPDPHRPQ